MLARYDVLQRHWWHGSNLSIALCTSQVFNPYPEPPLDCRVPIAGCPDFVPNPAPTDAFVPTNVFPDNVRGDNSNNVDDNIFPDNVRSQDLSSSEVNFGEPTK